MGFRTGAYATIFEVKPVSNTATDLRISISRKNKDGEYEQDFGGYVRCIGTAAANKALSLKEKDRIKLGDVDVSNVYNKEKRVTYTDFKIFSFEPVADTFAAPARQASDPTPTVDDGDLDDSTGLPF